MVYVEYIFFWASNQSNTNNLANLHIVAAVDLEEEDDPACFLGVCMECSPETGLLQNSLVNSVLDAFGLDARTAKSSGCCLREIH